MLALSSTADPPADAALPGEGGVTVARLSVLAAQQPADHFIGDAPSGTDLAAFFHTGGTTGTPKLAAHTHANEVTDAWMVAAIGLLDSESVVFAALPLFHVNALVVTLLAPLFKGQRVVWAGPLGYRDVSLYAAFLEAGRTLPRQHDERRAHDLLLLLAGCPVDARDIRSLRFALVGASPLPKAVRETFESATGVPLLEGYGLTEATCASVRGFPNHPRPGSLGQRLPYQRVKAVAVTADGEWVDLQAGEVGVLAISVPRSSPATSPAATTTAPRSTVWASYATAGWTPATWPGSTRTASCSWPGAPRTSSSAAATTSTRP